MNRGRRDLEHCAVGDIIDGWTVEAFEPDRLLRLSADMKLPGRGWLEFEVAPVDGGLRSSIRQTAIFDPRGPFGRLYWLATLPIHHLMFGGLLRGIVQRAEAGVRMPGVSIFVHRSVVPAAASEVFMWHERPQALLDLALSRRWVRVDSRTGSVRDGDRVTFSIGVGRLRVVWEASHYGYIGGEQFCDEQVRGPFRTWRHTHRIEAIGTRQTLYEDRIEYALPGGRLVHRLLDGLVQRLLARAFARRHEIVRTCLSLRPARA
jgi:ligand-binding SRPBCC domain-containing protein